MKLEPHEMVCFKRRVAVLAEERPPCGARRHAEFGIVPALDEHQCLPDNLPNIVHVQIQVQLISIYDHVSGQLLASDLARVNKLGFV